MSKTNNSPTPDTQIHMENLSIDKMRLTVTNIYPVFQKKIKTGNATGNRSAALSDFQKICVSPLQNIS